MRQAQLEDRSLTELRAMAQAMNAIFSFADDKNALIKIIRDCMEAKVPKPRIPDPVQPADTRLLIRPPRYVSTEAEIVEILLPFTLKGLIIRFPAEDQWMMTYQKREDSGTLRMPLRDVVECARRMMR